MTEPKHTEKTAVVFHKGQSKVNTAVLGKHQKNHIQLTEKVKTISMMGKKIIFAMENTTRVA